MARSASSPVIAGRHVQGLEAFRGSSQDGQYMPWDEEGTATLKLGTQSCCMEPRPPAPEPATAAALAVEKPGGIAPERKGWKDLPKRTKRKLELDDSPRSVIRLHWSIALSHLVLPIFRPADVEIHMIRGCLCRHIGGNKER